MWLRIHRKAAIFHNLPCHSSSLIRKHFVLSLVRLIRLIDHVSIRYWTWLATKKMHAIVWLNSGFWTSWFGWIYSNCSSGEVRRMNSIEWQARQGERVNWIVYFGCFMHIIAFRLSDCPQLWRLPFEAGSFNVRSDILWLTTALVCELVAFGVVDNGKYHQEMATFRRAANQRWSAVNILINHSRITRIHLSFVSVISLNQLCMCVFVRQQQAIRR